MYSLLLSVNNGDACDFLGSRATTYNDDYGFSSEKLVKLTFFDDSIQLPMIENVRLFNRTNATLSQLERSIQQLKEDWLASSLCSNLVVCREKVQQKARVSRCPCERFCLIQLLVFSVP